MPEMDGYEATAEIRRLEEPGSHVPIIALTANALRGDRERCLAAGMDDHVAKPITSEVLREVLSRWVMPVTEPEPVPDPVGEPGLDLGILDSLRAMQRPGDPDLVGEVIGLFVADAERSIARMRETLDAADPEGLKRAAHTLKGSSGNVGAFQLSGLCRELEPVALAGDWERAAALLGQLEVEFRLVRHRLLADPAGHPS